MTVIELDDDLAATLKAKAEAQQMKLEDWFRTLTDVPDKNANAAATGTQGRGLQLPALPLGNVGSLHRRDIYEDAPWAFAINLSVTAQILCEFYSILRTRSASTPRFYPAEAGCAIRRWQSTTVFPTLPPSCC